MRIGIDIDNIVVNTTESVLEYLNERLGLSLKIEYIKSYSIEDFVPEPNKLLVAEAFESKYMWKKLQLIPRAKECIEKLYNDGYELYFDTATLPENLRKKIGHLIRNLDIPESYIRSHTICISNKQLLNLDYQIDDYLGNLNGERSYYSICLDYPWNRDTDKYFSDGVYNLSRAYNWNDIYEIITGQYLF